MNSYAFLDQLDDLYCIINSAGQFIWMNTACGKRLHTSEDDFATVNFMDCIHPDDMPVDIRHQARFECRYRIGENAYGWVSWSVNYDTEHDYFVLHGRDLTDVKNLQAQVDGLSRQYTTTLETMSDAFFILDSDWRFTYVNQEAENLMLRTREELIGHNIWQIFPETKQLAFYEEYNRTMQTRIAQTFTEHYPPLGTWLDVTVYPYEDGLAVYFRNAIEREKSDYMLALSHQRIFEILESINDAFYALDNHWRFTYVNRRAEALWDKAREGLIGKSIWEVFPYLMDGVIYQEHMHVSQTRQPTRFETFSLIHNHWLELSIYPAESGLTVYLRDINTRKEHESALRESEAFAHATVNSISALVAILDTQGTIIATNLAWQQFAQHAGIDNHYNSVGINYLAVCDAAEGEDAEISHQVADGIRQVISREIPVFKAEYACPTPQEMRWFAMTANHFENYEEYIIIVHEDITELRIAQQAERDYTHKLNRRIEERTRQLNRIKEHVEAILNNTSDAIILVTDEGRIDQTNPAFNTMFKYEPDALFNRPLSIIFDPLCHDEMEQAINHTTQSKQTSRFEAQMLKQDGKIFDADVGLAAFVDRDTEETSLILSIRDITQRKLIEKELIKTLERERELSELKTGFVSVVSHEFRTPLAVILASAGLVQNYFDRITPESRTHHIQLIQDQVLHMRDLIDDVLSVTKAETGQLSIVPAQVDLIAFCKEVINHVQLTAADTHSIHLYSDDDRLSAHLDANLMRRVMMNLLSNAVKYSPKGGEVGVHVTHHDGQAVIRVVDSGIGIPKEDQERLFQTFQRASNVETIPGTGLGLMIAKQAVEAHGGSIHLTSEVGVGTTITISFPLQQTS